MFLKMEFVMFLRFSHFFNTNFRSLSWCICRFIFDINFLYLYLILNCLSPFSLQNHCTRVCSTETVDVIIFLTICYWIYQLHTFIKKIICGKEMLKIVFLFWIMYQEGKWNDSTLPPGIQIVGTTWMKLDFVSRFVNFVIKKRFFAAGNQHNIYRELSWLHQIVNHIDCHRKTILVTRDYRLYLGFY